MVRQRHRGWEKEEREDYYQGAIKETSYWGEGDGCRLLVSHKTIDGEGGWQFHLINRTPGVEQVRGSIAMDISKELAWAILKTDPSRWSGSDWPRIKDALRRGEIPDHINDSRRRVPRCACR